MSALDEKIRLIQNPAYGALLLTGFTLGYTENHAERSGVPLPYLFVALPILFHHDFLVAIEGTRLGLRKFAEKFLSGGQANSDLLLAINRRAIENRALTLESLDMMLLSGMGHLDTESGKVTSRGIEDLRESRQLPRAFELAERLGGWFSELSIFEIGSILKVAF